MILYLWPQFDCEIMITVSPCRAFCSAAEQPERRNGVMARRPFGQQASYFVVNHAALFNEEIEPPKACQDRFFKRTPSGDRLPLADRRVRLSTLGPAFRTG
jgi:hypothetical protein